MVFFLFCKKHVWKDTRTIDRRKILPRTSERRTRHVLRQNGGENCLIFRFDALWKSTRKEELSSAKLSSSDKQRRPSQHAAADNLFFTIHFAPGCVSYSFTSRTIGFITNISHVRSRSTINHARHALWRTYAFLDREIDETKRSARVKFVDPVPRGIFHHCWKFLSWNRRRANNNATAW